MKKLLIFEVGLLAAGSFFLGLTPSAKIESKAVVPTKAPLSPAAAQAPREANSTLTAALPPTGVIESFKQAFQRWEGTGDQVLEWQEKFARRLREDPSFIAEALERLRSETDAGFIICLGDLIARDSVEARDRVSQLAVGMIEGSESPERREAALTLLSYFPTDPKLLQIVAHAAESDADLQIRTNAIDTLGAWLRRLDGTEERAAREIKNNVAWELLQAINASRDDQINLHGLRSLALQDAPLSAAVFQAMPRLLQCESAPQTRVMAAFVLGRAADDAKDFAVDQLQRAFLRENDASVRYAFATNLVLLENQAAIERLKVISAHDSVLVRRMENYLETVRGNAEH